MSIKKTVAIAAAAGALTAVAMPALAFENEVHGIYNLKFFMSNYENGSSAAVDPTKYANKNKANNFFEQRARVQYIAKASDDLKLVTQFELDTKFGGDKTGKYGISSDAGVSDADGISLETKHVYLDFNLGKSVNVKTGIMPVKDAYKGRFVDLDLAGVQVAGKAGAATVTGAYYRLLTESALTIANTATPKSYNDNTSKLGHDNSDLFMLDGKFAVNKSVNIGASYYLSSDYTKTSPTTVHFFGVNADAKVGPATISGFVAAETGRTVVTAKKKAVSGYAANLAAKVAVGPGTLKTAALWETGDGNTANGNSTSFRNAGNGGLAVTYAEGAMMLLVRTGVGGTNNDRTIVHGAGAGDAGLFLYTLGYDATITPKLYANVNAGIAMVAKSAKGGNASDVIGTEINLETGYKLYDNLTAKVQGAYVFLGGIYDKSNAATGKTPENPYTARVGLSYAF